MEKLNERGIATEPFVAEDWGWYLPVKNEGFRLALCCGHQCGDDDQFLVFTDPVEPTFRKLFKTIDASPQLTRLTAVLDEILMSDPSIAETMWGEGQRMGQREPLNLNPLPCLASVAMSRFGLSPENLSPNK